MTKTYGVTLPSGRSIMTRTSNTYTHSVCVFSKWYEYEDPYWAHHNWCGSLELAQKKATRLRRAYRRPGDQVVILEVQVLD